MLLILSLATAAQDRTSSEPAVLAGEAIYSRELTPEEKGDVRFVADKLGLAVVHVDGSVGQRGTEFSGYAHVTYDTDSYQDSCIARQTAFIASSSIEEALEWSPLDLSNSVFVIWMLPCSHIEFDAGISSTTYPDLVAFRQLYRMRDDVIRETIDRRDKGVDFEPTEYRLRGISSDLQADRLNYALQFEGPSCHWLSVTVNVTGDTFTIVDSGGMVC